MATLFYPFSVGVLLNLDVNFFIVSWLHLVIVNVCFMLFSLFFFICLSSVNIQHERTRMASFGAAVVHMTLDVAGDQHTQTIINSLKTVPLHADMNPADCKISIDV